MQKETKAYMIDGCKMQFDSNFFRKLFASNRRKKGISVLDYEMKLGESIGVSSNAIHNWRFGVNAPSDVEFIRDLASCLGLGEYKLLLEERKETMAMQITERQKNSLKRIYDAVVEYLDAFQNTDGFNEYWHELSEHGLNSRQIEDKLYSIAETEQHKVQLVLDKEYIEIHKLEVYNKLEEYVYDDLCDIYNGKLSYAYRFEASAMNADGTRMGVTTGEDYTQALKKINSIIEPYM